MLIENRLDQRYRVFSLLGIPVYVSLWAILIAAFFALQAAVSRRPELLAWLLLLALVILLHELGHALAARRFGQHILGITLHLFGGLMEHAGPLTRRQSILVALAGPAVNLALLLPALALRAALSPQGFAGWLVDSILWLNLALLLFNLLPVYPLDGGQAFRALLYRRRGAARARLASAVVSLIVLAGAAAYALIEGYDALALMLLGLLAVINIQELRLALFERSLERPAGAARTFRPLARARRWIARRAGEPSFESLLRRAEEAGFEALSPDERRRLVGRRAELDLRLQTRGPDSLSESEQELLFRLEAVLHGRVLQ